jgi:hypothetical protein
MLRPALALTAIVTVGFIGGMVVPRCALAPTTVRSAMIASTDEAGSVSITRHQTYYQYQ